MATVLSQPKGFAFKKNLPLLHSAGSLGFDVTTAPPIVLAALATDEGVFPAADVELADVKLSANTPKPIQFGLADAKVSFTASGSAFAGFGMYGKGIDLLARLGAESEDFSLDAVELDPRAGGRLAVLRWGYDANVKASGAVALGALGRATIKAAGSRDGVFAVIRRVPASLTARETVQTVADSWIAPRQIVSVDQLEAGTWIVAEVAGSLSVSLGAQVGYDFNWVREATLGGLTGDIGLRLKMAIDATVGYSTSGRCAVVVSRDSEAKTLRVRMFRLKTRQFDASLNASLSVKGDTSALLPAKIDDFIAAVFDVHGQQILRDLTVLETWTDPKTPLADLLAAAGVDGAEALVARIAGVNTEQLQQNFDAVHAKATTFVTRWHALPHAVSSTLMKLVEDEADLTDVKRVAGELATTTPEALKALLDRELDHVDFFHSPVGKLLESIADDQVLKLLSMPVEEVRKIAGQLLGILDGSTLEAALEDFQRFVEERLNLKHVLDTVTETDFATLDALLKRKLSAFLGREVTGLADLEDARKTIHLLLGKRQEYYEKAVEALNRHYNFSLSAASQTSTTDQALFDGTFDFADDPTAVAGFLQQAIQGRLDTVFERRPRQVRIAKGRLTHGVKRQTQVDVTLPFFKVTQTHVNQSVGGLDAVAHDGGLLLTVDASDTITTSNRRTSTLSLAMALSRTTGTAIRVHQESLQVHYSSLYAKRNMTVDDLRAQIAPAVKSYFTDRISNLDAFLSVVDEQAEAAIPNRPELGNGLIALDVALAPTAAASIGHAFLQFPAERASDVYANVSTRLQASLKRHMHDAAFTTRDNYDSVGVERTKLFLAYCALVPRAEAAPAWFWDWPSVAERRRMLQHPQTKNRLKSLLEHAQVVLRDDSLAKKFKPEDAEAILTAIPAADPFLNTLLAAENAVVQHALDAGSDIATARIAKPSDAVAAIGKFGATLTEALHGDISTMLGPGMRSIGTLVLLDVALGADAASAATHAILNLEFLKPGATFNPGALLQAGKVAPVDLAFADRVLT